MFPFQENVGMLVPRTLNPRPLKFCFELSWQRLFSEPPKDPVLSDPTQLGLYFFCSPQVDGIWGIWGSYHNIPKTRFYLLKGDYICFWPGWPFLGTLKFKAV